MARRAKEKPILNLRVTRAGFEPSGPYDAEVHGSFSLGAIVTATVEQDKNARLLNLYWGFLDWVIANSDLKTDKRSLSNEILMSLGYHDSYTILIGGGVHAYPRSISEMDKDTFEKFANKAFDWVYAEFSLDVEEYKSAMAAKAGGRR